MNSSIPEAVICANVCTRPWFHTGICSDDRDAQALLVEWTPEDLDAALKSLIDDETSLHEPLPLDDREAQIVLALTRPRNRRG